jgi:hypothetical protein
MSELNYGLGFYLVEVDMNEYDLFNAATDKRILSSAPREKIISFLSLNLPTHPFLYQVDQEQFVRSSMYDTLSTADEYRPEYDDFSDQDDFYYSQVDYDYNIFAPEYTSEFSSTLDYNTHYSGGFVDREDTRRECQPAQLQFNFTYKNNKEEMPISSATSTPNEEADYPYLPDDTDGDTD